MSVSTETIHRHPVAGTELIRRWNPDPEAVRGQVVLVHGISEHSGRYELVGQQLARAGFATTAFDLIGHGATGGRRVHIDNWADLLDQVESHLSEVQNQGDPVILLGHSMGGLIAAEYVLSDRPSPDLLVLSAPALGGGADWQIKMAPLLAAVAPRMPIPSLLKGEQLSTDPTVGEEYFADPLVVTTGTGRFGAELFAAMKRVREHAGDIDIPTLTLHGADDTVVACEFSSDIGANGDRIVYPGLRHEIFNEPEGQRIVEEVIEWIEAHLGQEPDAKLPEDSS